MLSEQLDYFVQLFVVAVAVHKDFKLRVASFGFSRLYVNEVHLVFLEGDMEIHELSTAYWYLCQYRY